MTVGQLEVRHWLNRAFYADKKVKALKMLLRQCREHFGRMIERKAQL